ncbi:hypothetical protein I7I48_07819 [Histoplasma ohiense]|nr:hypothetical protein I7I48_07819 [Histoplasma ohiense (nom. inval.)]
MQWGTISCSVLGWHRDSHFDTDPVRASIFTPGEQRKCYLDMPHGCMELVLELTIAQRHHVEKRRTDREVSMTISFGPSLQHWQVKPFLWNFALWVDGFSSLLSHLLPSQDYCQRLTYPKLNNLPGEVDLYMAWRFSLPSNRRTPLLQIMQMRKATISPRASYFQGLLHCSCGE